jgi:hypothetical protein
MLMKHTITIYIHVLLYFLYNWCRVINLLAVLRSRCMNDALFDNKYILCMYIYTTSS